MAAPAPSSTRTPPRVWAFVALVLAVGVVGTVIVGARWGTSIDEPFAVLALASAFIVADRFPVYFELRTESIAFSLAEAAITVALFLLCPLEVVIARVAGGLLIVAFVDGTPLVKRAFNGGLVAVEAVVAVVVFRELVGTPDATSPWSWAAAVLAMVAATTVDSLALSTVFRLATGSRQLVDSWTLLIMTASSATVTTATLAGLLVWDLHPVGLALLVAPATVALLGYRSYVGLAQETRRVRSMYSLASNLSRAPALDQMLVDLVTEAGQLVGSLESELVVFTGDEGDASLTIRVGADGNLLADDAPRWQEDATHRAVVDGWRSGRAASAITGTSAGVAIATTDALLGSLVVRGRRRGRAVFDDSDRDLLLGAAGQAAAVIANSRLSDQLRTADEARSYLAEHDMLTGLGNRRRFLSDLDDLMAGSKLPGASLLLLNLRRFRQVNDTLGAAVGDRLLLAVADRLRSAVPEGGSVARLGGDEFVVVWEGNGSVESVAALVDAVSEPLSVRGRQLEVGFAAGVAHWPTDAATPGELLRCADLAMMVARQHVEPTVERYDAGVEEVHRRRNRLSADLADAIDEGEIHLHYQPLVDLRTERVLGVEALARWTHRELGVVGPMEFVAVAEEHGLVGRLTRAVIDKACSQLGVWCASGRRLEMSVNISVHDLADDRIVDHVADALRRHGIPDGMLTLEVTETAAMSDRKGAMQRLVALAGLGVGIAIDDFGTGHSSLAYLGDLPATKIKIDRAFITHVTTSEHDRQVVRAVVDLAGGRGIAVVAEGIEDRASFELLRELGVQIGQGFFMAKPQPASEIRSIIARATALGFPGPDATTGGSGGVAPRVASRR